MKSRERPARTISCLTRRPNTARTTRAHSAVTVPSTTKARTRVARSPTECIRTSRTAARTFTNAQIRWRWRAASAHRVSSSTRTLYDATFRSTCQFHAAPWSTIRLALLELWLSMRSFWLLPMLFSSLNFELNSNKNYYYSSLVFLCFFLFYILYWASITLYILFWLKTKFELFRK